MNTEVLIYIIGAGVFSLIFNYINRRILKDHSDSTTYAWWFELIRILVILPFFVLTNNFNLSWIYLGMFLLIGVSEFFSVYFYMKMHANSQLSISTIISQLRLVLIPVFAYIFLGERLGINQYFGIILIFTGQVLTVLRRGFVADKGVKYALLSSLFVATNSIVGKAASEHLNAVEIVIAMGIPVVIFFPVFMKSSFNRIFRRSRKFLKSLTVGVIFNSLSMYLIVLAITKGDVSPVMGIFQSISVLAVVIGIVFLKERDRVYEKILGGLCVLIGVWFLAN